MSNLRSIVRTKLAEEERKYVMTYQIREGWSLPPEFYDITRFPRELPIDYRQEYLVFLSNVIYNPYHLIVKSPGGAITPLLYMGRLEREVLKVTE